MIPCFTYFLLWPFGHFIKYTQGHPVMAIRPFHKVYPRASRYGHSAVSQGIPASCGSQALPVLHRFSPAPDRFIEQHHEKADHQ